MHFICLTVLPKKNQILYVRTKYNKIVKIGCVKNKERCFLYPYISSMMLDMHISTSNKKLYKKSILLKDKNETFYQDKNSVEYEVSVVDIDPVNDIYGIFDMTKTPEHSPRI